MLKSIWKGRKLMKKKKSYYDKYENHLRDGDDLLIDSNIHKDIHDEVDSDDTKQRDQYDREMEYDEMEY